VGAAAAARRYIEALGDRAPDGPILGAHVADVGVKEALIADDSDVYFTTPHFDGYAAILVRLDRISVSELDELIVEAWLLRARRSWRISGGANEMHRPHDRLTPTPTLQLAP